MKNNWEQRKLGDICKVIAGQSPESKYYNEIGDGLPFYQGKKDFTEKFIGEPTTWTTDITKEAQQGDVLISVRAPVGPVNFAMGKACIGRGLAAIRATQLIEKEFLFYFLLKHETEIVGNAGAVFNSISKTQIEKIQIPLPPLPEQQRIVAILDESFAVIAKTKENTGNNLQNARELFESQLQSIFTSKGDDWTEKKLGEVAQHSLGKMLDKSKNRGTLKPYLRNINVRWFECDLSDVLEMKFLEEEYERCTVIKGDILICEGGYPGRAAIWQEDYSIHFQKALHRVRFNNTEYNKFFVYYLYYLERTGLLKSHFTGTGIQHFTGQALHNLPLPLPPLKRVSTIIAQLDFLSIETQRLEAIYQQKLVALEELKKSILQKAFSGDLVAPHLIQQEMVWA